MISLEDPPFPQECFDIAKKELREAGVPEDVVSAKKVIKDCYVKGSDADVMGSAGIFIPQLMKDSPIEKRELFTVKFNYCGWSFYRAWSYWVVSTEVWKYRIPKLIAEMMNEKYFDTVRVGGYAGGQKVEESVNCYHIDTEEGFKVFVELLKILFFGLKER